jgi:ABC-type uncharacterized transport system ATPase subunit
VGERRPGYDDASRSISNPVDDITMPERNPKTPTQHCLLSLKGITKTFPGVRANDDIDIDIYDSEIHALLGENGAGKSTLVKILYGFYRADGGTITLAGKARPIHSPADAREAGIGLVFQDFTLIPAFTVAENLALFMPRLQAVLDPDEIERRIIKISNRYQLEVNPRKLISQLSLGEQQKVEILKLLISNARILILDEPTRVLAPHEVEALFTVLKNLRKDGYAIILITHKLDEVLKCADRVTILRRGRVAGTLMHAQASEDELIHLMFGKELDSLIAKKTVKTKAASSPVLELKEIETRPDSASTGLKGIDLDIHPGEIVGVAGVSGNGQKELCDLILGMSKPSRGSITLFGEEAARWSIRRVRRSGVAFIPESPLQMAVTGWLPIILNMALTRPWRYSRSGGFRVDWQKVAADARASFGRLGFEIPNLYLPAMALSGGNLQRMTIARELVEQPRLIIASYLTRGLDVQSTLAAQKALLDAREKGCGILLVSEDLEELFQISDRLIVMLGGRIVKTTKPGKTSPIEIGHLMTGSKVQHASKR